MLRYLLKNDGTTVLQINKDPHGEPWLDKYWCDVPTEVEQCDERSKSLRQHEADDLKEKYGEHKKPEPRIAKEWWIHPECDLVRDYDKYIPRGNGWFKVREILE